MTIKVDLAGRDLERIRGLIVPVNPMLRPYPGIRINLVGIENTCAVCMGRKASQFCETEQINVCESCNGFCENKAHTWVDLSCHI